MGQGVHTGGGRDSGRDIQHHAGVVHGDIRDDIRVNNHLFHLAFAVDDHRVAGHLRRRTGGGVDCHQRYARMHDFADAGIGGGRPRIRGEDFHRFCGIDRAAAAEGDKVIATRLPERGKATLHQGFRWVGKDLIEQMVRKLMGVQGGKQTVQQPHFDQLAVGNDQRLAPFFPGD